MNISDYDMRVTMILDSQPQDSLEGYLGQLD